MKRDSSLRPRAQARNRKLRDWFWTRREKKKTPRWPAAAHVMIDDAGRREQQPWQRHPATGDAAKTTTTTVTAISETETARKRKEMKLVVCSDDGGEAEL